MPGQPLDQTISLTGADQVKAQLGDLGTSGSASLKKLSDTTKDTGDGFTSAGARISQLVELMTGVKGEVGDVGESFARFGEILSGFAPALEGLAGIASLVGLVDLAKEASESASEIENMATAIGATTQEFEGFQFALVSVGASVETANSSVGKMLTFLGQADEALRKAADSSAALAAQQQATADSANLAVSSAQNAAQNSANSYNQSKQAITAAQVAVDKASVSYLQLRDRVNASNATGQQAAINAIQLRDAQIAIQQATQNVTNAQTRSSQALNDLAIASRRASLAEEQRRATMLKMDEEQDKGTTAVQQWAASLGVASAKLTEASTNGTEAFFKIIQGLHDTTDSAQRAERASALFGRGWISLIPAIAAGGDKLKAFSDEFEQTGLGLEKNAFEAASAFQKAAGQLSFFVEAIRNYLGTKVADIFAPLIQAAADFISENGPQIKEWATGFAEALKIAVDVVGAVLKPAFQAISAAIKVLIAAFEGISIAVNTVFGTNTTGPMLAWLTVFGLVGTRLLATVAAVGRMVLSLTGLGSALRGAYTAVSLLAGASGIPGLAAAIDAFVSHAGLVGLIISLLVNLYENWDTYWPNIKAAAEGFWDLMKAVYGWFVDIWTQVAEVIWGKILDAYSKIKDYISGWIDWFKGAYNSVTQFFSDAWNTAISFVEGLWNGFVDWISGVAGKVEDAWKNVANFFNGLWATIQNITGAASSAGASGAGGYATGGFVRGPGTATSDSIPAMLSNGEYVLNHDAVRRIGVGALDALNSGRAAFANMKNTLRMALGGFVGLNRPQGFASGGLAVAGAGNPGGHSVVNLHLGGNVFSLMGERGVVQSLTSAARKASIAQAGKSPSWRK